MKPKEILWVLFLAIAALILNGKPTWSQSVGGTQSERSGGDSQTPLPKGSTSAGSTDPSKTEKGSVGASKSGAKDTSVGGSQSERSGGDSQTPLPKEVGLRVQLTQAKQGQVNLRPALLKEPKILLWAAARASEAAAIVKLRSRREAVQRDLKMP